MSRTIEPIGLMILLGIFTAVGIDIAFLSTHDVVIQIELLATLSIICIAGLWYAGREYYMLQNYQHLYRSITLLVPTLTQEAVETILRQEFDQATTLTQHLAQLRAGRWSGARPRILDLRRAEKSTRETRIRYINLCKILHQNGFTVPAELALSDPWQWERLLKESLPK